MDLVGRCSAHTATGMDILLVTAGSRSNTFLQPPMSKPLRYAIYVASWDTSRGTAQQGRTMANPEEFDLRMERGNEGPYYS